MSVSKRYIKEIEFSTKEELIEKLGNKQKGFASDGGSAFRNEAGEITLYSKLLNFDNAHFTVVGESISLKSTVLDDINNWYDLDGVLKTDFDYLEIGSNLVSDDNVVIDVSTGINIPASTVFSVGGVDVIKPFPKGVYIEYPSSSEVIHVFKTSKELEVQKVVYINIDGTTPSFDALLVYASDVVGAESNIHELQSNINNVSTGYEISEGLNNIPANSWVILKLSNVVGNQKAINCTIILKEV
jgi:hypothetical protein